MRCKILRTVSRLEQRSADRLYRTVQNSECWWPEPPQPAAAAHERDLRPSVLRQPDEGMARPGATLVILAESHSNDSKITVQIPKEWQSMAVNDGVE